MTLLLLHAAATLILVGLIWTIQLVHYPLMAYADRASFADFHERHAQRMAWLVAPLMPTELVLSIWIARAPPPGVSPALAWTGLALVLVTWIATAMTSIPAHRTLARGFEGSAHRYLVRTNWIRTLAWTARGAIAIAMLGAHAGWKAA